MPNINITVAEKIATNTTPGVVIVCGNSDYKVAFDFDAEWAAETVKTARFVYAQAGVLRYMEVAFTGLTVAVPVLTDVREVYVGVYTDNVRTTTPARILCDRSILCGDGVHTDPPEDVYRQILEMLNIGITVALKPNFVNSVEECTDTSALYVLPDGYVYAYFEADEDEIEEPAFTNQIPISIDTDSSIYNGKGYKTASRINSSGAVVDVANASATNPVFVTGFIPVSGGDIVRLKNCYIDADGMTGDTDYWGNTASSLRIGLYNKSGFSYASVIPWTDFLSWDYVTATADSDGRVTEFKIAAGVNAYIRLCLGGDPETAIVTINEVTEASPTQPSGWINTGHAFVPADYEDRIIALEKAVKGDLDIYGIVDNENNVIMSGSLTPGTYTLKYQNDDGTTSEIGTFEIN